MNVEFKNDLENNLMYMTISVPKRKYKNQENVIVYWAKANQIMLDQYTAPKGYSIGECRDKYLKINNEYNNLLEQTWTFPLVQDKPKTNINVKSTKAKTRTTRRKKNA